MQINLYIIKKKIFLITDNVIYSDENNLLNIYQIKLSLMNQKCDYRL